MGGRYKIVQYEALAREPEVVLRDICDFLGENYSSQMLMQPPDNSDSLEADLIPHHAARPIWITSIGRFRHDLSAKEIAFFTNVYTAKNEAIWLSA